MRIALVGSAFSGKTSLADYLAREYNWTKLNYTDLLKEAAARALSSAWQVMGYSKSVASVSVSEIKVDKKAYRPLINELGTVLGFDKGEGVDLLLSRWAAKGCPEPVVWDCVRFEAQAKMLRQAGFVMVGLRVSLSQLKERATALGVSYDEFIAQYRWDEDNLPEADIYIDGEKPTTENSLILNTLAQVGLPSEPKVQDVKHAA